MLRLEFFMNMQTINGVRHIVKQDIILLGV